MSVKGLEESEKIAAKIQKNILKSLRKQKLELEDELAKVQYLLSDPEALKGWRAALAGPERVSALYAMLDETEKLYLEAGDTQAARIFRRRMEAQLKQKLTNIKANKIEVEARIAKSKIEMKDQLQNGFTEVRRECALREMYTQARGNGGFFANFGRPYLTDLVTLETKAAGSKTIGEYMSNLYNQYEVGLKDVFINGLIRGDSYKTMQNNLMRATDITAGKAKLLVRTESNAIFNQSVLDVINDNPLVKGYRFRAVLDSRTSKICQEHDGEYIPKEDVKPGVNYPPLHPNCRSTVTTVLVDEDEKKDAMQRYTKNDKNQWEKVPPGMTYQEYKEKFGFSNSKRPRPYNPPERDIHDASLARIKEPSYQGYVKPSRSATARIQKYKAAYDNYMTGIVADERVDYDSIIEAAKKNTKIDRAGKALLRQSQAESGYDMLPMKATKKQFDKEVKKNGYRVIHKKFTTQEDVDDFISGKMKKQVYAFTEPTEKGPRRYRMALRTSEDKILKPGQDSRINDAMDFEDEDLMRILAVEYGYDAIEYPDGKIDVLNRTAVIIEDHEEEEVEDVLPTMTVPAYKPSVIDKKYYDEKHKASFKIEKMAEDNVEPKDYIRRKVSASGLKASSFENTPDEVAKYLYRYTGSSYGDNNLLRDLYRGDNILTRYAQERVDRVDKMAAYMYENRIGVDMTVSRGTRSEEIAYMLGTERLMGESPEYLMSNLKDKKIVFNQFESTTVAKDYTSYGRTSPYQMRIYLPASTPGVYINDLSSFKDEEYEFLLPPGVKYTVVNVYKEYGKTILECVVLEDDFELPEGLVRTRTVLSKEA